MVLPLQRAEKSSNTLKQPGTRPPNRVHPCTSCGTIGPAGMVLRGKAPTNQALLRGPRLCARPVAQS